jgi:hypothetical protein
MRRNGASSLPGGRSACVGRARATPLLASTTSHSTFSLTAIAAIVVLLADRAPLATAQCTGPPNSAHVNETASSSSCASVPVGDVCVYVCDAGYVASGSATCSSADTYSLATSGPACIQTCDVARDVAVAHATVSTASCTTTSTTSGVVLDGEVCAFDCSLDGSVLEGASASASCSGGQLVATDGSSFCALPCASDPPLPNLDGAATACEGTAHGATCTFACLANYSPAAGTATARCWDGAWDNADYCAAPCLGSPAGQLEHFAVSSSDAASCVDALHGVQCPFQCEALYTPVSSALTSDSRAKAAPAAVACEDGVWQVAGLKCEQPCRSTPFVRYSDLEEPECNNTVSGGNCSFGCEAPWVPHGGE